ncbi:MAG: acyl-CoA dehydrogenase family protein, partial [Acidimicrobiales bacterium]
MWMGAPVMGIADGPTEVHKDTIAKTVLKGYEPYEGLFPRDYLPHRIDEATKIVEARLEHEVGNL